MIRSTTTLMSLGLLAALSLGACGDDSSPSMDGTDTSATGGSTGMESLDSTGTGDPMTTTTTATTDTTGETTTGNPGGEYDFDPSPPDAFSQVDRMGMPAINTAVISSKDAYNAASPTDDLAGDFVSEIVDNLTGLHAALDDDLTGLGLVPCDVDTCVAQAAPLVVPDTIAIDLTGTAGFPNGRLPADPVIDVTLAVVLLDLSVGGQDALTLVGVNPTANDVAFSDEFPYFAAPHQ